MKCPACGSDNPEGAIRCSGCRGEFTGEGVDYSKPKPSLVEWTESYPSEKEEERMRSGAIRGYFRRLISLIAWATISAVLGSYFLYDWRIEGNDGSFLPGLVMLAIFSACVFMLWRVVRDIYAEPDSEDATPSHEDAEVMHFEATGLPPRR